MIADLLKYTPEGNYSEAFRKVFEYLKTLTKDTPDGTVELDGKRIYVMIQSGMTSDAQPDKLELHRKYIDIQYVIDGVEGMIYAPDYGNMEVITPYDEEKDYTFVKPPAELVRMDVTPGMFAVFTPRDAHFGKLASRAKGAMFIKKAVAKVLID